MVTLPQAVAALRFSSSTESFGLLGLPSAAPRTVSLRSALCRPSAGYDSQSSLKIWSEESQLLTDERWHGLLESGPNIKIHCSGRFNSIGLITFGRVSQHEAPRFSYLNLSILLSYAWPLWSYQRASGIHPSHGRVAKVGRRSGCRQRCQSPRVGGVS